MTISTFRSSNASNADPTQGALSFLTNTERAALAHALHLSPREALIAELILNDSTEHAIAARIGISQHTVHTYLDRIYKKTGAHSRCQLAIVFFHKYVETIARRGSRRDQQTSLTEEPDVPSPADS